LPRVHLDAGLSVCEALREVYKPFEKVLSDVLDMPLSEVRQRRREPKENVEELYHHWISQKRRYDDVAARFIPKAIRCLQNRRFLPRHPDRDRLNRTLANTRLGWVIFPGYYRAWDFCSALDVELGIVWWMVAAKFGRLTWEDFAKIVPWDYQQIELSENNVLQYIEANWLLRDEENFRIALRSNTLISLASTGRIPTKDGLLDISEILAKQPYYKIILDEWGDWENGPILHGFSFEERIARKQQRGLSLDEEELLFVTSRKLSWQEQAQKQYEECPAEKRLQEAIERAKRGLWGWLRAEAKGKPHSPEWYIHLAELTNLPIALRKAEAAHTFLETSNPSEFYQAWEVLAEKTEIETELPADLNNGIEPIPTLGEYLKYIADDLQLFVSALRERLTDPPDFVRIVDDRAEKAFMKGDNLAAAGIPGDLL